MAIKQDVELKGASTTIPLRIITDEKGEMLYQEEQGDGASLLNPTDGIRFVETFDSWHEGAFIPRFIQNGWYNKGTNINAMDPGEIKPSARRLTYKDMDVSGSNIGQFGFAGMMYEPSAEVILLAIRHEATTGSGVPDALQQYPINSATLADVASEVWANAQIDGGVVLGDKKTFTNGYTNVAKPYLLSNATNYRAWPSGTQFQGLRHDGNSSVVALDCHAFAVGGGRVYKIGVDAVGGVGISNCDINSDMYVAGNWTTPVIFGTYDTGHNLGPAGVCMTLLDGIPIVGTPGGIYVLGPGGIPENMTPQFEVFPPGSGNLMTMIGALGGVAAGMEGRGAILWFAKGGGALIGPDTNPLAQPDRIRIMDMLESPRGDLWVLGYRLVEKDIVVWVGKKVAGKSPGPASFNWHPYLQLEGDAEMTDSATPLGGAGRLQCSQQFLPYQHPTSGLKYLLIGGGSKDNVTKLIRVAGEEFFGDTADSEDTLVGTATTVVFTSGRYSRKSRNQCFFTRLVVRGFNFGSSGVRGGTVTVALDYDGAGSYSDKGTLTNTTDGKLFEQTITLNKVAWDADWKLTWGLNGATSAMSGSPATVTQITLEGKEIPDKVRVFTLVVEGLSPKVAGGTRSHKLGTGLRDQIETLSFSLTEAITFTDPYNNARTVYITENTVLSAAEAARAAVPEGSIRLLLVEVVG